MRVVGLNEFGEADVLQVLELPDRHAGPGEVRIRVHAATVNPTDTGVRDGSRAEAMKVNPPPYIPGMDAAGVIDEIGPDTQTDLKVGDTVMAMVIPVGSHGAYEHDGEEFIYVLLGRFQIAIEGRDMVTLNQGESIYFRSNLRHSWQNPGQTTTVVLWVNTPPTF